MSKEKDLIQKEFDLIDKDKNNLIEFHEFIEYLTERFQIRSLNGKYTPLFRTVFTMCDTKGLLKAKDGKIDRKEFVGIYQAFPTEIDENPKKTIGVFIFHIIDENHSGKISFKEMFKFTSALGFQKEKTVEFISSLDTNDDKKIDLNEFLQWFLED